CACLGSCGAESERWRCGESAHVDDIADAKGTIVVAETSVVQYARARRTSPQRVSADWGALTFLRPRWFDAPVRERRCRERPVAPVAGAPVAPAARNTLRSSVAR